MPGSKKSPMSRSNGASVVVTKLKKVILYLFLSYLTLQEMCGNIR